MKTGEGIVRLAWILLVILGVGAAAILLSRPSTEVSPLSTDFAPGGAAAFAELLRQEGFSVEILDSIPGAPTKDALVITFLERSQIPLDANQANTPRADGSKRSKDGSADSTGSDSDFSSFTRLSPGLPLKFVTDQLKAGGSAFVLGYERGDVGRIATGDSDVQSSSGRHYTVTALNTGDADRIDLSGADASYPAWTFGKSQDALPFASIDSANGGLAVVVPEGEIALNSFIDQKDNAKFLVDAVRLLAPENRRIELVDGSVLGAGEMGLIDTLGPWAHGIEIQLALLGIVIVYSLGKRFGLADETLLAQRGSRDLLDGIADTYARSQAGKAALAQLTQEADRNVRRYLKLPADAPIRKRNDMLPQSVAAALTACEFANSQMPSQVEALELARRLETELEVFISRRTSPANRRRRRVKSP